jgi:hypothetical protein
VLNVPENPGEGNSAKDATVAALLKRWPMSARQVWYSVRKRGAGLTYSAIYKAISELAASGVLAHDNYGYSLDARWLRKICSFSHSAGAGLLGQASDTETEVLPLRFRRLADLDAFVLGMMREAPFCSSVPHCWYPIFYGPELKETRTSGSTIIFKDSCGLDRQCRAFLHRLGARAGVAHAPQDVSVYGDAILQVLFSDAMPAEISSAYEHAEPGPRFRSDFAADYLERKTRITALLVRNRAVAGALRQGISAACR